VTKKIFIEKQIIATRMSKLFMLENVKKDQFFYKSGVQGKNNAYHNVNKVKNQGIYE
jgi:hypothetical protein